MNYQYIADLAKEMEIPKAGILTRVLYQDERVKAVIFGFDTGQELSEHTASVPAILSMVKGSAKITLGEDILEAEAGAWIHLNAQLPHSILAKTPVVMLLLLLR
ncbi:MULTISPECIES: cupin domain-containing protein [Planktothricoides]|uniref:Cupin domain-containing protein n=2 Tax=Planktothricoides raciborskii TaxID=132608 RepID=A0AAU8JFY3_9CYAN|nr:MULTISPECIES: cupin domain-containing protein [Planktothricoides]KOR35918.1 cupin [Planktothricoides sp. SR001]MBD2544177.1 cupin domain-containing protein [Planktothricoides raciborskii FACHB-1370]MBD2583927.1 cupin domain-containing protein [Planktothricoides raciborskii FACHB-1261]